MYISFYQSQCLFMNVGSSLIIIWINILLYFYYQPWYKIEIKFTRKRYAKYISTFLKYFPRLVISLVSCEKLGKTIKSTSKQVVYKKSPLCFLAFVDNYTGEYCSLHLTWASNLSIPRSKSPNLSRFSFNVHFD